MLPVFCKGGCTACVHIPTPSLPACCLLEKPAGGLAADEETRVEESLEQTTKNWTQSVCFPTCTVLYHAGLTPCLGRRGRQLGFFFIPVFTRVRPGEWLAKANLLVPACPANLRLVPLLKCCYCLDPRCYMNAHVLKVVTPRVALLGGSGAFRRWGCTEGP